MAIRQQLLMSALNGSVRVFMEYDDVTHQVSGIITESDADRVIKPSVRVVDAKDRRVPVLAGAIDRGSVRAALTAVDLVKDVDDGVTTYLPPFEIGLNAAVA